jgi:Zn-dependent peptidase ImmA (M78 family)
MYVDSPISARFAAKKVLASHWSGVLPVDPGSIAEALGVTLIPKGSQFSPWEYSGYFRKHDLAYNGPVIEYNRADPLVRRRFTVAHELGHYVLGHDNAPRDDAASFGASVRSPVERAANQFAAELLMPEDAVKKLALSGRMASVEQMAEAFKVSKVAMNYRLSNLNLSVW